MKRYIIHIGNDIYEQEGDEHLIYEDKIIIFKEKKPVMIISIKKFDIITIENI
jgi:hypothetical protein